MPSIQGELGALDQILHNKEFQVLFQQYCDREQISIYIYKLIQETTACWNIITYIHIMIQCKMCSKWLKAIVRTGCKPAINKIKQFGMPFLDECPMEGFKVAIMYYELKKEGVQGFRAHAMNKHESTDRPKPFHSQNTIFGHRTSYGCSLNSTAHLQWGPIIEAR